MLGCLLAIFAFFLPRVVILLLGLFSTYITDPFKTLSSPFNGLLLPVLGFIFLPYTLLAYCVAMNQNNGSVSGMWTVLVIVAVLFDLGVIGGGSKARKKRVVVVKKSA